MKNFSKILTHTIPKNNIDELSACEIGAIIKSHETLTKQRSPQLSEIKIHRTECNNPGDERTVIDIIHDDIPTYTDVPNFMMQPQPYPNMTAASESRLDRIASSNFTCVCKLRQHEIHLAQSLGPPPKISGLTMPTFLPETA